MWSHLFLAAALLLYGSSASSAAERGYAPELQGTWRVVSTETKGKIRQVPIAVRLTVKKDKMAIRSDSTSEEIQFQTDESKAPRWIDLIYSGKRDVERKGVAKGIYKIEGDLLTICFNAIGNKTRPVEFRTAPGSGFDLEVYRRERKP